MSRRWRNPRPRRGRYWNAPPAQVTQTATPPPQFLRPAGPSRAPARLITSRHRRFGPPFPASVSPAIQWATGTPFTNWTLPMGYQTIGLSQLALEYVLVPVAATRAGAAYNPTADTVQFAFMPQATQVPGSGDWVAGSWDTDPSSVLFPYSAKCLVGPGGTANPGIGTYVMYLKISDSPEVPVLIAGQLEIS